MQPELKNKEIGPQREKKVKRGEKDYSAVEGENHALPFF